MPVMDKIRSVLKRNAKGFIGYLLFMSPLIGYSIYRWQIQHTEPSPYEYWMGNLSYAEEMFNVTAERLDALHSIADKKRDRAHLDRDIAYVEEKHSLHLPAMLHTNSTIEQEMFKEKAKEIDAKLVVTLREIDSRLRDAEAEHGKWKNELAAAQDAVRRLRSGEAVPVTKSKK